MVIEDTRKINAGGSWDNRPKGNTVSQKGKQKSMEGKNGPTSPKSMRDRLHPKVSRESNQFHPQTKTTIEEDGKTAPPPQVPLKQRQITG